MHGYRFHFCPLWYKQISASVVTKNMITHVNFDKIQWKLKLIVSNFDLKNTGQEPNDEQILWIQIWRKLELKWEYSKIQCTLYVHLNTTLSFL